MLDLTCKSRLLHPRRRCLQTQVSPIALARLCSPHSQQIDSPRMPGIRVATCTGFSIFHPRSPATAGRLELFLQERSGESRLS